MVALGSQVMLAQKHAKDGRVLEPARVLHTPTWFARTSLGVPPPPPSLSPPQAKGPSNREQSGRDGYDPGGLLVEKGEGEGLLVGDAILAIDGKDVRAWPLAKIGPALRGTRGSFVYYSTVRLPVKMPATTRGL